MLGRMACLLGFHRWGVGLTQEYIYPRVCCLRCGEHI